MIYLWNVQKVGRNFNYKCSFFRVICPHGAILKISSCSIPFVLTSNLFVSQIFRWIRWKCSLEPIILSNVLKVSIPKEKNWIEIKKIDFVCMIQIDVSSKNHWNLLTKSIFSILFSFYVCHNRALFHITKNPWKRTGPKRKILSVSAKKVNAFIFCSY